VQDKNNAFRGEKESSHNSIGVRNDKSKECSRFLKPSINGSPEEVCGEYAKFK